MSVFTSPSFHDHESVTFCRHRQSGLKAIIAVHDTTLGPALGGTRMWPYAEEQAAIEDVLRLSRGMKGGAGDGDPSPATAWGIFHGIRAAVRHQLKRDGLAGIEVAVQGLGHVGWRLAEYLHHAGAKLTVTDINAEVVARAQATFGARAVASDAIYGAEAEIFAPCALGGILNGETIPRLRASIVAGSANNQLAADTDGVLLHQRGILYAPDYVINAGGIINIAHEGADYDRKAAFDHCAGLYDTCLAIFARAETEGRSPHLIADEMAEERLAASRAQGSVGLRATG